MALDNLNDDQKNSINDAISTVTASTPESLNAETKQDTVNLEMQYGSPLQNPYTLNGDELDYHSSQMVEGIQQKPSFLTTFNAEYYNFNTTAQGAHAEYEASIEPNAKTLKNILFPVDDPVPLGWNSKTDVDKFVNVQSQYLPYLFDAKSPKDQEFRLNRIYSEQAHDETLANGSFVAKMLGGLAGVITDPISYIPIVGWAKYGKLGAGFVKNALRAAPGASAYSVLSSGAKQADKINGNLEDFAKDAFIDTIFATSLFGVGGAVATSSDKMQIWNMRKLGSGAIDGIDYRLETDTKGKITGYKAVDTTGSLSAAKVDFYQDLANSSFDKSGLFKVPYLGAGISHILDMKVPYTNFYFGSQLRSLLDSTFKTARGFYDRIADHSIRTIGQKDGEAAPKRFASLMQQSMAEIRSLDAQITSLHLERNGFDIQNRVVQGFTDVYAQGKDKLLKVLGKDLNKDSYVSKEGFYSEIEDVLINENSSDHAAVNEAAAMFRKHIDAVYANYRKSYNLPDNWLPPKTAEAYLMRVYNTPLMNSHRNEWINIVGNWLRDADVTIDQHMQPIRDLDERIKIHREKHEALISRPNITDQEVKASATKLMAMKSRKKVLEENIQNQLRNDPDLALHVDDWNALSADEAKQIEQYTKKQRIALKEVNERKAIVQGIKDQAAKRKEAALKSKTVKTAKGNQRKSAVGELVLEKEQAELDKVQREYEEETQKLQEQMHNGEIDSRLYFKHKDSFVYEFKDPNNRLKFRDTYGSGKMEFTPETHAKAYYDTIMGQTPEQTIAQVMGKFTGHAGENHLKQRTLLLPDNLLYGRDGKNGINFMSPDLMAKVANYTSYLARRTHIKSVLNDVTIDGGIEPLLNTLNEEYDQMHNHRSNTLSAAREKLSQPNLSDKQKKKYKSDIKSIEKELASGRVKFERIKSDMNHTFDKIMGMKKYSKGAEKARSVLMALTAIANLPFVPFTQITDLSAIVLQHGIGPFIRDGVYPIIQNIVTLGKGKEGEAFRKTAPSVHLALQDVLNGYADRNWGMYTNPYLNMGRTVNAIEKLAHLSSNFSLTNYIDNFLQRTTAAVTQSELMRIMHAYKDGTITPKESLYIRKYGIDPRKWSDRMITAFEQDGGGKTKLGGYQSLFHQWQDMEAANEFGSAVFNGVKDTQIQSGIADSPFWTDNPLGAIAKGFGGWMYASVNRYVIPTMQQPDAQRLIGVLTALGAGYLVDPMRRFARGEDPFPKNQTWQQQLYAAFNNAGVFSWFATTLSNANLLTSDRLLGNLRSDKYKNRSRAGLLGPTVGTINNLWNVIDAAGSGEWNKADMAKAARMLPYVNSSWMYWMSKRFVDSLNIPATRRQARAMKGS